MSLLGCRVVRGPDWKWDQQDGGEGCVGTVVSLENFSDGRTLPRKTALVCWDSGNVADYRIGLNGCHDLRIYDSAPGEVLSPDFTCNGCSQSNIAGSRWHCTLCYDYDLCNVCYMNDVHDKDHQFERCDASNDCTNGTKVTPRSRATKVRAKGLFPGTEVKQGRDWGLDSELGTMTGRVVGVTAWENVPRSALIVKWGTSLEVSHRVGHHGKVDLQTVTVGHNGPFYYKEHLQIATSALEFKRFASTGGEKLYVGDRVTIHLDAETLKLMSEGHGGWVTGMEKVIGKVGKISKIGDDGDVFVDFGLMNEWAFHPEAIVKVRDLRAGDKVRVLNSKELVMKYQNGHGGWNNAMENALGQQGNVLKVDHDGDALVNVSNQQWLFNAAALVLESKEEERRPPGERTGIGNESIEEHVVNALLQELMGSHGIEQLVLVTTLGDMNKVKEIIENDQSLINQKSATQKTALMVACHQGHPEIVSYLLEKGADKDLRDEGGYSALHHAAYGDKSGACVVTMLSANANVNVIDGADKTKVTPLHLAIQQNNERAVIALAQFRHCNANLQNKNGDTPLHCTILLGQTKNCISILEARRNDLDPTIFNDKGINVLHLSCLKNRSEVADILIDRYPGLVDMVKEDGFSSLHLAALNNRCTIAKKLLLSGHCDINMQNKEGRTALSMAVGESDKEMIELLIEHQADPNVEDNDGDTALHLAIMKHCMLFLGLDLAELLGKRPLQCETKLVNSAITLFLIFRGADVNHRNHQAKTPIDLCIDKRLRDLIAQNYSRNNFSGAPPRPLTSVGRSNSPSKPKPMSSAPPNDTAGITTILHSHLPISPNAIEHTTASSPASPASPEPVSPPSPAREENNEANTDNIGVEGKQSNNQLSSEIHASVEQEGARRLTINQEGVLCTYCEEGPATVVFEPCKHKIVCQTCSFRAKKCLKCKSVITNKTVPGEDPYKSLTDFKRNYEEKLRKLRGEFDEIERIAICQICMEFPSNVVFAKCGHKVCERCSQRLRKCHMCQTDITKEEKIFTF